ncbi:MAG: glycosyltransferase family 2 protein [Conexibacter sp.]
MPATFTIAVPTHDRRETVLLAVRSALAQTRAPEQVIVLCDGCTDGTADALRALGDPRVEVLELKKAPGYGYEHRNRSLERARGEAIVWLADDDLLMPDHLERLGELWDTGRYDLVHGSSIVIHPDDTLEWLGTDWSVPTHREELELRNTNPMASIALRVELAQAIGGWDASVSRAADWDLWKRAFAAGARSAFSLEPTHLHFRASGREQAWPLRVRQNTAWLARIEDPDGLRDVRIALHRAHGDRMAHARAVERWSDEQAAAVGSLHAEVAARDAEIVARDGRIADLEARLAAAQAESARHGDALARIEAGGWWRLRRRLLPLMRLAGRAR